jgi:hypothetical protein
MAVLVAAAQFADAFNRSGPKELCIAVANACDVIGVVHETIKVDAQPVRAAHTARWQRDMRAAGRGGDYVQEAAVSEGRHRHDVQNQLAVGTQRHGCVTGGNLDKTIHTKRRDAFHETGRFVEKVPQLLDIGLIFAR